MTYSGEACLESGNEACGGLGGVALLLDQGVLELEGSEGGNDRDDKNVNVGDEDDGALVGDALIHTGLRQGAPLVDVQDLYNDRKNQVCKL